MSNFDLNPLYRTLVGFDRIANLMDQATRHDVTPGYPPFNIVQTSEDKYRIELAVAGFAIDDLGIETRENLLTISGKRPDSNENGVDELKFVHRGIAERNFERRFNLADHVRVVAARLENGLLVIDLVREIPEAARPRQIAIEGSAPAKAKSTKVIDANRAA